jgi:MraZ protein
VFVGVHERQIDDKGRLSLPATIRDLLGDRAYLSLDPEGCLMLREPSEFESHARSLIESERRGELSHSRRRSIATTWNTIAIDKQGRLTLDESARGHAGLLQSSSITIVGNFDVVELWRPSRYEVVRGEDSEQQQARRWDDD